MNDLRHRLVGFLINFFSLLAFFGWLAWAGWFLFHGHRSLFFAWATLTGLSILLCVPSLVSGARNDAAQGAAYALLISALVSAGLSVVFCVAAVVSNHIA